MQKTIVSFGEILWDLLPDGARLGGAPFNFVYRANCLGERGLIVSRLGRDKLGEEAFRTVSTLGMETAFLQWDEKHPTGTVKVSFDKANNPDYVIIPGVAYDYIETTPQLLEAAATADCICFGTLAQRRPESRRTCRELLAVAGNAVKLLDINLRKDCYSAATVTSSLEEADVLKLNEQEAFALKPLLGLTEDGLPEIARELMEKYSPVTCVITLDERGALAVSAGGETVYVPGYRVALVDSLGSGDAFTAGFIYKYLRGLPLAECCVYGNALGAIVATQKGGTAPLCAEEVMDFLRADKERIRQPDLERFAIE